MNQVLIVKVEELIYGAAVTYYPGVLRDEKNTVLIDCGYPSSFSSIQNALLKHEINAVDLTHIFITHHDHDHMGSLHEWKQKYPKIKIVSSHIEAPFISGAQKSLRLIQAEQRQESLPEEMQEFGYAFCAMLKEIQPVPVDMVVTDKEILPWAGGCTVMMTPGHTPGHCSLYVSASQMLIAGDAAVLDQGELIVANPEYAIDIQEAEESLRKIKALKAKSIVCYHGGIYIPETD